MLIRTVLLVLLAAAQTAAAAPPRGWYLRLSVEAPAAQLKDDGNLLGQLSDAVAGYDSHDLDEPPPTGTPNLTLVFPHGGWGGKAGTYTTDFHALGKNPDTWSFEVRSDDPNRKITLRWIGERKWLKRSTLVDLDTGKVIAVKPGRAYRFAMNGSKRRAFAWDLAAVK